MTEVTRIMYPVTGERLVVHFGPKTPSVTLEQVVASLERRGFYSGVDMVAAQTQIFAVTEETGESARLFRRLRQGVEAPDPRKLELEAADLVISAICYGATVCGSRLSEVVLEKMEQDEKRGYRHSGGEGGS